MTSLEEVEGIGETYARKLRSAGVNSLHSLFEQGSTAKGRKMLAEKSRIGEKKILEWVKHADLCRIRGVGSDYADLLAAAGVETVRELAKRKPENLYYKLEALNDQKRLVRRLPSQDQVSEWVRQAKRLPGIVTY